MAETTNERTIKYRCGGTVTLGEGTEPCGADLTKLIDAVPQDGEERKLECEACGTTIRIRRTPPESE